MIRSFTQNSKWLVSLLSLVTFASLGTGCGNKNNGQKQQQQKQAEAPPPELKELVVKKVSAQVQKPDPAASYWNGVAAGTVKLVAQPMVAPRPEKTTTESITVQAVHDGNYVAFRIRWKDTEKSEAGKLAEFSDALALEFPLQDASATPVMMGGKGKPVHLFHWRAQYQRDKEKGKPQMKDLYPNMSVDMYPHEFKTTDAGSPDTAEMFNPGVAEGNPQSYIKTGVDEIIAEGFATSSVQAGHGSEAMGVWKNGEWDLVITRKLNIEGGSVLKAGAKSSIAFAAWQGGKGEVGSRKCVTMAWTPVTIE